LASEWSGRNPAAIRFEFGRSPQYTVDLLSRGLFDAKQMFHGIASVEALKS